MSIAASPLLVYAAFRDAVVAELDDKTVLGTASRRTGGIVVKGKKIGNSLTSTNPRTTDPVGVKDDVPVEYRACDEIALQLTQLKGSPPLMAYWPASDKERAIAALKSFMKENSSRLPDLLPFQYRWFTLAGNFGPPR